MIFEKFVSLFKRNPFRSPKEHVEPEITTRYIRNEDEFMHYLKPYLENLVHERMQTYDLKSGKCFDCGRKGMLEPVFDGSRTMNEVVEGLVKDLLDFYSRFRLRFLEMYFLADLFWKKYLAEEKNLFLLCERCEATYEGRMRYSDKPEPDRSKPGYWPYRKRVFNKRRCIFSGRIPCPIWLLKPLDPFLLPTGSQRRKWSDFRIRSTADRILEGTCLSY